MKEQVSAPGGSFQLCRLIGRIRAEFVDRVEQEMGRCGVELNFSQFLALKLLGEESMAPGELARLLRYNAGAMTRMLDKLEQRGYLRRVPDPDDRRALRLELTPAGKAIRKRLIQCSGADRAARHVPPRGGCPPQEPECDEGFVAAASVFRRNAEGRYDMQGYRCNLS